MATLPALGLERVLAIASFVAMLCSILFLDAVLPLAGFWLHTSLLTELGSWPLLPTHLLFPGRAISSSISGVHPGIPPSIILSWQEVPLFFLALVLLFACYLLALRYVVPHISNVRLILYSTFLLGLLYAIIPVVTSLDVFSYISYARIGIIHHLNPLTTLPISIRPDPILAHITWLNQPSAYGPTWIALTSLFQWGTLVAFGAQALLPMLLALRVWGLVTHLSSTLLIWAITGRLQSLMIFSNQKRKEDWREERGHKDKAQGPHTTQHHPRLRSIEPLQPLQVRSNSSLPHLTEKNHQGADARSKRIFITAAFAWNPLLLFEACVNAHNDSSVLLLVLLAIWFLLSETSPEKQAHNLVQRIPWLAIIMLALATCLKLNTVLLVPGLLIFLWKQWPSRQTTQRARARASIYRGRFSGAREERTRREGKHKAPSTHPHPLTASINRASTAPTGIIRLRGGFTEKPTLDGSYNGALLAVGGTLCVYGAIILLLYAPFWQHGAILDVFLANPTASRNINSLAEFVSRLYNSIRVDLGYPAPAVIGSPSEHITHDLSLVIFVVLYCWLCWRAMSNRQALLTLPNLIGWMALTWLLYCAIGSPWFWPWYTVIFFGLYALLGVTSDEKSWLRSSSESSPAIILLAFAMLLIYLTYVWGPHKTDMPGLITFQWGYLRGLWVLLLPLFITRWRFYPAIKQKDHGLLQKPSGQ